MAKKKVAACFLCGFLIWSTAIPAAAAHFTPSAAESLFLEGDLPVVVEKQAIHIHFEEPQAEKTVWSVTVNDIYFLGNPSGKTGTVQMVGVAALSPVKGEQFSVQAGDTDVPVQLIGAVGTLGVSAAELEARYEEGAISIPEELPAEEKRNQVFFCNIEFQEGETQKEVRITYPEGVEIGNFNTSYFFGYHFVSEEQKIPLTVTVSGIKDPIGLRESTIGLEKTGEGVFQKELGQRPETLQVAVEEVGAPVTCACGHNISYGDQMAIFITGAFVLVAAVTFVMAMIVWVPRRRK